ncbi:glycoside hydrolase family 3 N-terminal domain-containing protein [Microvirga thermotolerans]|uniref:beta-glucosidase n=1 Tax=Microvirga thermotolerans TaxID=2651334 RepID=A0A5P9K0U0_9HYPH|nr:glycoside hydrolase family 3 N-terminal domain-containing protein [Microvirga thermotolerans]QFU17536.1 beta-glucosidase [Microvirga thermotolerans]
MTAEQQRVDALLRAMTLEEKIGQLIMPDAGGLTTGPGKPFDIRALVVAGRAGSLLNVTEFEDIREVQRLAVHGTRLGIPLLLGLDVLHGHRTIFPVPFAEAAAFDPDLWRRTARAAAEEATAEGINLTFAPMLDIARDPRWGRIAESPGEDPLVARRWAEAKVRGFQHRSLALPCALAATAKHFAGYGAVAAGREYAPVDLSERLVREVYLPPFEAAVQAGVAAVMTAFTDLAGVPMTANAAVLRDVLRGRWGFDGVVVSDYGAIAELIHHGVAEDLAGAAALALRAGVDIDMASDAYATGLPVALEHGTARMEDVDAAVRRVLSLKAALGLFKVAGAGDPRTPSRPHRVRLRRELAREAAQRSIVLLKNERAVLPLGSGVKRLALVGPLVDARADMLGPWSALGEPDRAVTYLEGLAEALPEVRISAVRGIGTQGGDGAGIREAVAAAAAADAVVLCLGEDRSMSGEAASRASLDLPGLQRDLAEAVLELGRPAIVVLTSGRPLAVEWLAERADAFLAAGFLGHEAGRAMADVLTGRSNPSGRLPVSWPRAVGQVPVPYSQRPGGRPFDPDNVFTSRYLDLSNEPLFRFGEGLSYTTFVLEEARADRSKLGSSDRLLVQVDVRNEGPRDGEETVFLFIHDPVASVSRPVLELKDFARIVLAAGGRGTVSFTLAGSDLSYLDAGLHPRLDAGLVEILVGTSADRKRLHRLQVEICAEIRSERDHEGAAGHP